jgi:predicted metal-dependent phosphoesterase TrpH
MTWVLGVAFLFASFLLGGAVVILEHDSALLSSVIQQRDRCHTELAAASDTIERYVVDSKAQAFNARAAKGALAELQREVAALRASRLELEAITIETSALPAKAKKPKKVKKRKPKPVVKAKPCPLM